MLFIFEIICYVSLNFLRLLGIGMREFENDLFFYGFRGYFVSGYFVYYISNNLEQFPKIFRCILNNILDFLLYGYKNEKVLLFLYRSEGYRYQRNTVKLSKFQVSNLLILRLLIVYLC